MEEKNVRTMNGMPIKSDVMNLSILVYLFQISFHISFVNESFVNKSLTNESFVNESFVNKSFVNKSFVNKSFVNESFVNKSFVNKSTDLVLPLVD